MWVWFLGRRCGSATGRGVPWKRRASCADCDAPPPRGGLAARGEGPADANLAWPGRVHGELDPGGPAAQVHFIGPAADEHLRPKALNLLLECLQIDGLYFGARAQYPDADREHVPVDAVVTLEGHQYTYLSTCFPVGTDLLRVTAAHAASIGHSAYLVDVGATTGGRA